MTAEVRFDEAEARTSTSITTDGSVLQAMLGVLGNAGIDAVAELYNEALEFAGRGDYANAQSRLHALLALAPSDAEAHLLLAKVFVGGQQWRRANAALDRSEQCGGVVAEQLREMIVRRLNQGDDDLESERRARLAREQGEIRKLRNEARQLRGNNAHLVARNRALETETRRWAWISAGTSTIAIAFMLGRMLFGSPTVAPAPEAIAETPQPSITEGLEVAPVPDSPRNGSLAEVAAAALLEANILEDGELEVIVRSSSAQLSGTVKTHAQMVRAAEVVEQVPGIDSVGTGGVIILAQRDGATHVVASGETLGQIAYNYYGRSSHYQLIVDANSFLNGKTTLKIGQALVLPPLREDG